MQTIIFIIIISILAIVDYKTLNISNWILLPAIAISLAMTHNYTPALLIFLITALLFNRGLIGGADVKTFVLIAAFMGHKVIGILIVTAIMVGIYRLIKEDNEPLPLIPFMALASFILIK